MKYALWIQIYLGKSLSFLHKEKKYNLFETTFELRTKQ